MWKALRMPDGLQKGTLQDHFTGLTTLYSLSLSLSLSLSRLQMQWRRKLEACSGEELRDLWRWQ
jgi:hypothetical protein